MYDFRSSQCAHDGHIYLEKKGLVLLPQTSCYGEATNEWPDSSKLMIKKRGFYNLDCWSLTVYDNSYMIISLQNYSKAFHRSTFNTLCHSEESSKLNPTCPKPPSKRILATWLIVIRQPLCKGNKNTATNIVLQCPFSYRSKPIEKHVNELKTHGPKLRRWFSTPKPFASGFLLLFIHSLHRGFESQQIITIESEVEACTYE